MEDTSNGTIAPEGATKSGTEYEGDEPIMERSAQVRQIALIFRDDLANDDKDSVEVAFNTNDVSPEEMVTACATLLRCIFEMTTFGAEEAIELVQSKALESIRRSQRVPR